MLFASTSTFPTPSTLATETVWPVLELAGADAPVLEPLLPPQALRIKTAAARARSDMYVVLRFI
jgi:hypothetical protein